MLQDYNIFQSILDGDAILFTGAGCNFGVTNQFGDPLPTGDKLKEVLYTECNEKESINNGDLQDASEEYISNFGKISLISLLQRFLSIKNISNDQKILFSIPWKKIYTTNYDNVPILAAEYDNKDLLPITLNSSLKEYINKENEIFYLNGYIGNLTEITLDNDFKLSDKSFFVDSINQSQWKPVIEDDLYSCKYIILLGMSFRYDLDIQRLLHDIPKANIIIINRLDISPIEKRKLERIGTISQYDLHSFCENLINFKSSYISRKKDINIQDFLCFKKFEKINNEKIQLNNSIKYEFLVKGVYSDDLLKKEKNDYDSLVYRKCVQEMINAIKSKKHIIYLHGRLGNGKTTALKILENELSLNNYNVFELIDVVSHNLGKEFSFINKQVGYKVIIIEDFYNYIEELSEFSKFDLSNTTFILSARSAMFEIHQTTILDDFNFKSDEVVISNVNKLQDYECRKLNSIFNATGIYGEHSKDTEKMKIKMLELSSLGNCEMQSILLSIVKSTEIGNKIIALFNTLKDEQTYYDVALLSILSKVLVFNINGNDINSLFGKNILNQVSFRNNQAISELFNVKEEHTTKISICSSVTAILILQNIEDIKYILTLLIRLANYVANYSQTEKYSNILKNIISFSHISSVMNYQKGYNQECMLEYYDILSKISYYSENFSFWLQYAIACIAIRDFERAQRYIDNAYSFASKNPKFIPFQINTQQAHLLLEKIKDNKSKDVAEDFKKAHALLMLPITSPKDNEASILKNFNTYIIDKFRNKFCTIQQQEILEKACIAASSRIYEYCKNHSTEEDYKELAKKLLDKQNMPKSTKKHFIVVTKKNITSN
jgi:hypothetical protein